MSEKVTIEVNPEDALLVLFFASSNFNKLEKDKQEKMKGFFEAINSFRASLSNQLTNEDLDKVEAHIEVCRLLGKII